MNRYFLLIVSLLIFVNSAFAGSKFTGTWCVGNQRLVIEFPGKNAIVISSRGDDAFSGKGTYTETDTSFTATIKNEELEIKIGYTYKFKDKKTLRAKITFFTVDGEAVDDYPKRWLRMQSCNPDTFDFDAAAKEELSEN